MPPSAADEETLGHEPVERVEVGAGDRLDRLDRRAPGEHGHAGKAGLLVVVEQAVAPIEGRLQRLLAGRRILWPAAQRAQRHFQASGDLARGEQGATRRRELDRQRQPVEPPADRHRRSDAVVAQLEVGVVCTRALAEQREGVDAEQGIKVAVRRRVGHRERWHEKDLFGVNGQGLAAGGEHRDAGAGRQQLSESRRSRRQVFAVVHHQEQMLGCQEPFECLLGRLARDRHDVQCAHDRAGDIPRPLDRRKRDEPRAVGKVGLDGARGVERQSRLAHPSRAGQRQDPPAAGAQLFGDLAQLAGATDRAVRWRRQRAGPPRRRGHRRDRRVERGVLGQDGLMEAV